MKLKRLLCALVVFTLMMTSVVCSVSAATYKTTTVYNVSGNPNELGTVSLKTEIAGANPGSMVSYIIYDNTDGSGTVDADGTDIEYIDQKTVDEDGNVTLGSEAKFSTEAINGRRYVFASNGGEQFDYETLSNTGSVKIERESNDVVEDNWKITARGYADYGMTLKYDEYVRGQATPNSGYFLKRNEEGTGWEAGSAKLYPDSTLVVTTIPEPGYYVNSVKISRTSKNYSGGNATVTGAGYELTDYHIGNKIKLDLSDMTINGRQIAEPGAFLQMQIAGVETYDEATAKYIKVDSKPIYTTTADGHLSATFLMTKSANIADDFGINVYAIPTTGTGDVTLASAEARFEGLKAEYVDNNKFGIQLITAQTTADGTVEETAKYFDSSKYDLVAVPYYNGTELRNSRYADLFYITDNETDLSGGTFDFVRYEE